MTLTERIAIRHEEKKNKKNNNKPTTQVLWLDKAMGSKRYTGSKVYSDGNRS